MSAADKGKKISDRLHALESQFDLGQNLPQAPNAPGAGVGEAARKFPMKLLEPDERDMRYAIKDQLIRRENRYAEVTDDEIDYILKKYYPHELASKLQWFEGHYDMSQRNPVMMQWGRKMMPELWDMRKEAIERNAEIQKRIAYLRLLGPESQDDIDLLFAIDKGQIRVPRGPIWEPEGIEEYPSSRRGVFNPNRHIAERAAISRNGLTGYLNAIGPNYGGSFSGRENPFQGGGDNNEGGVFNSLAENRGAAGGSYMARARQAFQVAQ